MTIADFKERSCTKPPYSLRNRWRIPYHVGMSKSIGKIPIIAIVGPTASGKSALAVSIAKKINGEIISADSRQVFRHMNLGTGKITTREQQKIPHHLLDIASPKVRYTVSHFIKDAHKAIAKIAGKGKMPILVGGTGFWIDALLHGQRLPNVKPHYALRKKLQKKNLKQLVRMLENKDPARAKEIDRQNPYRLIRALEIIASTGKPIQKISYAPLYAPIYLGIRIPKDVLHKRIQVRLHKRMQRGMMAEVKRLRAYGVSWKRLEALGLEYRFIAYFLQKKMDKQTMLKKLEAEIQHFAKRQHTWFRRNPKIYWVSHTASALQIIKRVLTHKHPQKERYTTSI